MPFRSICDCLEKDSRDDSMRIVSSAIDPARPDVACGSSPDVATPMSSADGSLFESAATGGAGYCRSCTIGRGWQNSCCRSIELSTTSTAKLRMHRDGAHAMDYRAAQEIRRFRRTGLPDGILSLPAVRDAADGSGSLCRRHRRPRRDRCPQYGDYRTVGCAPPAASFDHGRCAAVAR